MRYRCGRPLPRGAPLHPHPRPSMLHRIRSRPRTIAVATAAFAGGLLVASGMDWTATSRAATLFQAPAPPGPRRVQPVADLSQAFISIAQSVTPAVVSIETERAARRAAPGDVPQELR